MTPPVLTVLRPACALKMPPVPDVPLPTVIATDPPVPPVAVPEPMDIDPELPPLEVPDENTIAPLAPAVPALAGFDGQRTADDAVPSPAARLMAPPVLTVPTSMHINAATDSRCAAAHRHGDGTSTATSGCA